MHLGERERTSEQEKTAQLIAAINKHDLGKISKLATSQTANDTYRLREDTGFLNADGMTPMHLAAQIGDVKIAKLLRSNGANLNGIMQSTGETPLHLAAYTGKEEMVDYLLEEGRKAGILKEMLSTRNNIGKNASSLALGRFASIFIKLQEAARELESNELKR